MSPKEVYLQATNNRGNLNLLNNKEQRKKLRLSLEFRNLGSPLTLPTFKTLKKQPLKKKLLSN